MMNETEAIIARHSVRSYKPEKIEEEKAVKLKEKIEELNRESGLHLQFLENAGNTYNNFLYKMVGMAAVPSVIVCAGKDSEDLERKIGYYGEKLVLYAQSLGLNTCWTGSFNKKNTEAVIGENERLVICIAIGYGKDQGKPHKSKELSKLSEAAGSRPGWFEKGVEMAALAPTALNQQKFLIRLNADETVEFIDKAGAFGQIDLGIVKCHFEIGSGKKQTP